MIEGSQAAEGCISTHALCGKVWGVLAAVVLVLVLLLLVVVVRTAVAVVRREFHQHLGVYRSIEKVLWLALPFQQGLFGHAWTEPFDELHRHYLPSRRQRGLVMKPCCRAPAAGPTKKSSKPRGSKFLHFRQNDNILQNWGGPDEGTKVQDFCVHSLMFSRGYRALC